MDVVFRCDSPVERRLMHLTITPERDGRVRFHSIVAERDVVNQIALWDRSRLRSGQTIRACSWCHRIEVGDSHWIKPDVAADVLGLMLEGPLPPVSITTCGACCDAVNAKLQSEPSGDKSEDPATPRLPRTRR